MNHFITFLGIAFTVNITCTNHYNHDVGECCNWPKCKGTSKKSFCCEAQEIQEFYERINNTDNLISKCFKNYLLLQNSRWLYGSTLIWIIYLFFINIFVVHHECEWIGKLCPANKVEMTRKDNKVFCCKTRTTCRLIFYT